MSEEIKVYPSSGNVFADLGLAKFSVESLFKLLNALGNDVKIVVTDR